MSSIDHGPEQETADTPAEQIALVDGSVGSDTDSGGPLKQDEAVKDGSDIPHHARSNSVKKPTTFKAVSVTKNFLAKAGTPTAPAAKTNGDNAPNTHTAGTTIPPAPRPRLVAKTASGNKVATPKSSHFNNRHGGSGPDPMQVWNRNRAAPQSTPKHFTDEELKQQYGIHLATRLQADGDGKESKWADIDDDEDDWAPETIEWNDGTKITLAQDASALLLAEEQAKATAEKERQEEEEKARKAAQQKATTTVGPNATVLKPRSAAQTKPGSGLVLKTPSEKPTLVAKPTAPAAVRSPWAALPPVDKVPPVDINPPNQQLPSRSQYNEPYGNQTVQPPPPAAMEIAADDFTRTRGDTPTGNLGQLYNAQSGQYEPANTGRRGSVRKDGNFRPPALLQRGSQSHIEQHGPAEPSAAFQTSRNQQDTAQWNRRGSSTVSGESGPQGRRMSMNKGLDMARIPNEVLQQRRDSQPLQSPSTPGYSQLASSQRGPSPMPQSATQSPALQHSQLSQTPYQNRNDDVVAQKQLMKEKRELAIKRKKEEEDREEAAKKERIRIKMEKLGLPPLEEKKEPVQKALESRQIEKRELTGPSVEAQEEFEQKSATDEPQASAQYRDGSAKTASSTTKPHAPDAPETSQQYGMMRVHGAPVNNVQDDVVDRLNVHKTRNQTTIQRISPPGLEPKAEGSQPISSPRVNGVTPPKHPDAPLYKPGDVSNQNMLREQRQQPWNNAPRESNGFGSWNEQNMARDPAASNSVWGPPAHARNLGNGTFDRSIQRPQSRQQDDYASPALAPIGPPKHLQRTRDALDLRASETSPSPAMEDFQTIPTYPPVEGSAPSTNRGEPSALQPAGLKRVSPPQLGGTGSNFATRVNDPEPSGQGLEQQKSTLAAWGNFQATDAEMNRQRAQQQAAKLAEEARLGIRRPEPQLPVMNETWRQVKVDEQGSQRQITGVQKGQNSHDRFLGAQVNGDVPGSSLSQQAPTLPVATSGMGRGSRFFPGAGTGMYPQYQNAARFPPAYRRSSSPPPPEDEFHFHPAFTRDPTRPLVNLPFMKEKPKVRLPPSAPIPVESPQMPDVRNMPLRAVSQPLVNNPSWQDRFNGLLRVQSKSSPEKKFAQVNEFSATKVPLDATPQLISASVSLPPKTLETVNRKLEVASKAMEDEEELFENREFGSLPAVHIPNIAPEIGWIDARISKKTQGKQLKASKEADATSKDSFVEKDIISNGGVMIFIKMQGMGIPKSVTLASPNPRQGPSQSRPRNFSGQSKPNKGYKPRENSGNFQHDQKTPPSGHQRTGPSKGPTQGRGQPSKNHPAWGQRTTNAVH